MLLLTKFYKGADEWCSQYCIEFLFIKFLNHKYEFQSPTISFLYILTRKNTKILTQFQLSLKYIPTHFRYIIVDTHCLKFKFAKINYTLTLIPTDFTRKKKTTADSFFLYFLDVHCTTADSFFTVKKRLIRKYYEFTQLR